MLLFVVLAIFVAGLMVGRTPEYVGKKIEAREVKMAMLAILVLPLMYLGWTAVAVVFPPRWRRWPTRAARLHRGALRLHVGDRQQRLGLRGLTGNTFFYNLTLASFDVRRPFLHDRAGDGDRGLAGGQEVGSGVGRHVPTTGGLFVGLVVGVILIIGGLTFFPALALGPIVEHLAMNANTLF
jgi:K+-transporting ATPase ATPase A chain